MQNKVVYALIIGFVLTMAGCASGTRVPELGNKTVGNNLYEVINARVDVAYLDPTVDFSRYNKVMVMPLDFSQMKIVQPSTSSSLARNTKFELTDAEKEKSTRDFRK